MPAMRKSLNGATILIFSSLFLSACSNPASTTTPPPISSPAIIKVSPSPRNTRTPFPATVTPSGPLFTNTDENVRRILKTAPQTVGDFTLSCPVTVHSLIPADCSLIDKNGALYLIRIIFHTSAEAPYLLYQQSVKARPNGQIVALGDGSIVDASPNGFPGVLIYRNVDVSINPVTPSDKTPIPLTNERITAALKDVYEKILVPNAGK